MKRIFCLLAILVLPAFILNSCSKNNPTAPKLMSEQGNLVFSLSSAENIASGKVTIKKGSLTRFLPITIENHTGTVQFDDLQVGIWSILIQLFDADGIEIYTGEGGAEVLVGATVTVTITVIENTGELEIIVNIPTPTPTPTTAGYKIVYVSGSAGGYDLYLINSDGTNQSAIAYHETPVYPYSFPNNYRGGDVLVFSDQPSHFDVWQIRLDGSELQRLNLRGVKPRWSWDGSKIASFIFEYIYNSQDQICTYNSDGSNFIKLPPTSNEGSDRNPCWTPDGRIIYNHYTQTGSAIHIMDADGNNRRAITNYALKAQVTDCSRSYTILFTSGVHNNIYSIDVNGNNLTQLTARYSHTMSAHFSADGQKIVYYSFDSQNQIHKIYMMDQNGSNKKYITDGMNPFFVF